MEQEMTHEQAVKKVAALCFEYVSLYKGYCRRHGTTPNYADFCDFVDRHAKGQTPNANTFLKEFYKRFQQ